jgi:acyl-coenzyme A synthetase/AMP-(fatty) acid ligase
MSSTQRIYESTYGPVNVPTNVSVPQFLARYNVDDVPDSKVITSDFDDPQRTLTFGGVRKAPGQGATGLSNVLNVMEGDVVCILGLNSVNWLLLAHSVMWTGAVFAGINAVATSHELVHYFEISRPKAIAVDANLYPKVQAALKMSTNLQVQPRVLLIEDGSASVPSGHPVFPRDIMAFSAGRPPLDLTYRDNRNVPAAMCFSSGTSGKPKGVLLSHHNLIAYSLVLRASTPLIGNFKQVEVFYPPFPHIYGIGVALMGPAYTGQHLIAMKKFDFVPYLKKCSEMRATIARMVPATAIQLLKDPAVKGIDLTSINTVFVAGASLPVEVADGLAKRLQGVVVVNGYGMSEGAISTLKECRSEEKSGSIGKPQPGHQIRIVDDALNDVTPGKQGQCLVRGPTVFIGYFNNDAATKESFQNGWLCTGDVISMDSDGYLWFCGRSKELIKYKGNQVPPAELEDVLLSHEAVNEAGVCGLFDERLETEVPVGYVNFTRPVPVGERDSLLADIRKFVDERVSPHKKLRGGLFFLDALPKNATGKLMRRELPAANRQQKTSKL